MANRTWTDEKERYSKLYHKGQKSIPEQKPKQDMPELNKMIAKFKEITTPKFEQAQKAHSKFVKCKCLTKQEKDWLINFIIEKSGQQTALATLKMVMQTWFIYRNMNWLEAEIKKLSEGTK